VGLHGLAFEAGLAAENLTESQFGMASTKFRWNVSGTYMQAIPRIFSTDADGDDPREFLADAFPSMAKLATSIFLKGYQWPFDPQRITDHQSSLIDLLVSQETQRGRRVFLDFRENPTGNDTLGRFDLESLEEEAIAYLRANEALQPTPIERLAHMNPLAIDIYAEHGIDLHAEPLEIAVCAQHCNGGFAVNHWWESSLPHTFVIGEMAGTHGVKRPGGSALNAGQVGGLRAAEYIVNVHGVEVPSGRDHARAIEEAVTALSWKWSRWMTDHAASGPADVQGEVRARMTAAAAHLRRLEPAEAALDDAMGLVEKVRLSGLCVDELPRLIEAIQAEHLALTSVAFLKAIVTYLREKGGSRGSFLVTTDDGQAVHPMLRDSTEKTPLCCLPENVELRGSIFQVVADDAEPYGFKCEAVPVRKLTTDAKAFEAAWRDYRDGRIYEQ
jgi:succinate dehydrogenase/fumarate reductase flavoprotein subunit